MQTEIAVIKDNSIALSVMAKLGMLRVGKSGIFSSGAEDVVSEAALTPKQREHLIHAFEGHLEVVEVESSRLIAITYTSDDPIRAANVANQVVSEYKTYLLSSNFSSSKEASQWLAGQLSGLSDQVTKSEQSRSSRELYDRLYAKLQEEDINSNSSATNVTIVDPARPPGTPWMPQPMIFAVFGLGGGLLFGLALGMFLLESQANTAAAKSHSN